MSSVDTTSLVPPRRRNKKKRRHDHYHDFPAISSDPPIFSSDPPDDGLDTDRRKRIYRGTWWGDQSSKQGDFSRKFDSGVFIPSDDSLPSFDYATADLNLLPVSNQSTRRVPTPYEHVQSIVNDVLEQGAEIVDLSELKLIHLHDDVPNALGTLVKMPRFLESNELPTEQVYASLAPRIQMFLANNSLASLPPSLWSLENLTVLSIRNNALTSIPASISRLTSLVELNLANNRLRWLPWELLSLLGPGKPLTKLHVRPNPFFVGIDATHPFMHGNFCIPADSEEYGRELESLKESLLPNKNLSAKQTSQNIWLRKLLESLWHVMETVDPESLRALGPKCLWSSSSSQFASRCVHIATTPLWFFEKDGSVVRDTKSFVPSRAALQETYLFADPYCPLQPPRETSRVPSLLEIAMVNCSSSSRLSQMLGLDCPPPVLRALEQTCAAVDEGGRRCGICSKRYHIPRCEWVEYWHCIPSNASAISPEEMFWPFLRRGCSWACVPRVHKDEVSI